MSMLDIDDVDLADLALALEDHSDEHLWWLDRADGSVHPHFGASVEEDGALPIDPLPVAVGYRDMEDFVAYVRDVHARDLLERAIVGRGAFRRFKDALGEFPELRRAWFAFHDARGERRAIAWLAEHDLVSQEQAAAALATREDPEPADLPGLLDAHGLARRVALDLRRVYRRRLRGVLLIGPWVRGQAPPETPVDLLVVLDAFTDRWAEKRRIERTLWRHSVRNGAVVTALPLLAGELRALVRGATPDAMRAVEGSVSPAVGEAEQGAAVTHLTVRAREEIGAAHALLDAGFPTQALSRACSAALCAAESVLALEGEAPASTAGVVGAFARLVVVEEGMAPEHARALRRLYEDRGTVDHALAGAPEVEAREAVAAAEAILEACAAWTSGHAVVQQA
jgi:uncharacterized protein (UPF0332 family)